MTQAEEAEAPAAVLPPVPSGTTAKTQERYYRCSYRHLYRATGNALWIQRYLSGTGHVLPLEKCNYIRESHRYYRQMQRYYRHPTRSGTTASIQRYYRFLRAVNGLKPLYPFPTYPFGSNLYIGTYPLQIWID